MLTGDQLRQRLAMVYQWYQGMVNSQTGMLEYLYLPETETFVRERSPIRDIASVWDAEILSDFLGERALQNVIERSLAHYVTYLAPHDDCLILDPVRLEEPSSIAHSAFMILALLHAPPPRRDKHIAALAEGIRRQQRRDGSYKVFFHDLPDSGEELYAGEAMLALMEAYRQLGDQRALESAERAFRYYDAQYFQQSRVAPDVLVFFANWQSQACRLLFECWRGSERAGTVAGYLYRMHDRIIDHAFFDRVEREPARQVSVEVACALEGLNEGYAIARATNDPRSERYARCLCIGLAYLLALQRTRAGGAAERGGFGLTLSDRTQRIDITGHAASALMRSIENTLVCPTATS